MNLNLPDVAAGQSAAAALPLKWVGMEGIAIPVNLTEQAGSVVSAKADVFVSLDQADAKGIHMSRLYLRLKDTLAREQLSTSVLGELLKDIVDSQQGLSVAAKLKLDFELTIRKPALLSEQFGYQTYPISINCEYREDRLITELSVTVPYSSTCPCSAALSRQAMSDAISAQFSDETISKQQLLDWVQSQQGSVATPHSQRSYAYLTLQLANNPLPDLTAFIGHIEEVIGTPVQTAVKREDEQAFAKLNAENLMFCEDAARRLKQALENNPQIMDYCFKVEHQESLHAHNAVVIDHKFPQGYKK